MKLRPRPTARVLVLAFLAIAIAFLTGIALGQRYVWRIRAATHDITGNAAPSIQILSNMRSAVRELEVLADDYTDACAAGHCAAPPARLTALRAKLSSDWESYQRLPTFPGEQDRWVDAVGALSRLDAAVGRMVALVDRGRGAEAEEVLNRDLKPACDRLDATVAAGVENDAIQASQVEQRIRGLARRALVLSLVLGLVGAVLAAITAFFAVRFARRSEQLLRVRAEELDHFAGQMAHDVLSPLTGMAAAVQIAQRDASPHSREVLERGLRSLLRSRDLVNALLAFARAEAAPEQGATAEVKPVLAGVVDELRDFAEEHQVFLFVEKSAAVRVACSPGVLMSVLGNTVRNAIKYMGASPRREVCVRVESLDERTVRLEVEDTGPGMPAPLGDRVFEPFVRGVHDGSGSGLGLATVKRLVTAHGGRIGFHSGAAGGTLLWVELQQVRGAPTGHPSRPAG
jgi:signal transduction histidine kinase